MQYLHARQTNQGFAVDRLSERNSQCRIPRDTSFIPTSKIASMHLKIKGRENAKSPRNLFENINLYSFLKVRVNGEQESRSL